MKLIVKLQRLRHKWTQLEPGIYRFGYAKFKTRVKEGKIRANFGIYIYICKSPKLGLCLYITHELYYVNMHLRGYYNIIWFGWETTSVCILKHS